jgi:transposase-like protein
VPANATICTDLQPLLPEHLQLIALRVQRHSWTKCAAHLGVDRATVYRWRQEFPEIDRRVAEECADQLELAKETLPSAVHAAVRRMHLIVENAASENRDAIQAAKLLIETVAKPAGSNDAGA